MWPVIMSNGQAATFSTDLSCNASSNDSGSSWQQHVARAATGPTAAAAAWQVPLCCYSLPTHTTSPSPLPAAHPLHILSSCSSSSTSNCNSKSNSICVSKWKMSTTRARIAFPIAIKNIYNANAADQRHRAQWYTGTVAATKRQWVRHCDRSTHRLLRATAGIHHRSQWESVATFVASALRTVFECATPK